MGPKVPKPSPVQQKRQWSIFDFSLTEKRPKKAISVKKEENEEQQDKEEADKTPDHDTFHCPLCQFDLTMFNINARSVHVNRCMDPFEKDAEADVDADADADVNVTVRVKTETTYVYQSPKKSIALKDDATKSKGRRRRATTKKLEVKNEEGKNADDVKPALVNVDVPVVKKRRGKPKPPIPELKRLRFSETDIIAVDAFCYAPDEDIAIYLLTHFHADHYGGLCKSWDNGSIIICTAITARLMRLKFNYPPEKIFIVEEYEVPTNIPNCNVVVTVFDANHCPGAGVFVLECNGLRYLHCGDFRANEDMIQVLSGRYPGGFDKCYLDTTYNDPKYCFPKQQDVVKYASEWVKMKCETYKSTQQRVVDFFRGKSLSSSSSSSLSTTSKEFLVVIGTYSIGKEKLALGIAQALDTQIYCKKDKYAILKTYDWKELDERITTENPAQCNVHLLPIGKTKKDAMREYLQQHVLHYKSVMVVRPTGWTFGYSKDIVYDNTRDGLFEMLERGFQHVSQEERKQGGVAIVRHIPVPYSEHSSYAELEMFRRLMDVREWINTV